MISIVYFENDLPSRYRLGLNLATLLGSMVGQVVLGYYADRLGRRKVYGLELAFTIVASLGLATASNGAFNSMSLMGLLIFWRAVMGIGMRSNQLSTVGLTMEYRHWIRLSFERCPDSRVRVQLSLSSIQADGRPDSHQRSIGIPCLPLYSSVNPSASYLLF